MYRGVKSDVQGCHISCTGSPERYSCLSVLLLYGHGTLLIHAESTVVQQKHLVAYDQRLRISALNTTTLNVLIESCLLTCFLYGRDSQKKLQL